MTKRQIAEYTTLSFATVSSLTNQMVDEKLVSHGGGTCASNSGRMSALLTLRTDACFFLAISFAITDELRMALISLNGQRAYEWSENIRIRDGYEALLDLVSQGMTRLLHTARLDPTQILDGSAAVPAMYDRNSRRIINSTIPLYEGHFLADDLHRILGMEISIENEANLMSLACFDNDEQENGTKDLIFLYVGEDLSAGIATNRKIFSGSHGYGGVISHIPLGHAGYTCYCGKKTALKQNYRFNVLSESTMIWHSRIKLMTSNRFPCNGRLLSR